MERFRTGNGVLAVVLAVVLGGLVAIGSAALHPTPASAATSVRSPTTVTVLAGNAWTTPSNIDGSSDGAYGRQTLRINQSDNTTFTGFDFGSQIPSGSTVSNVSVAIRYRVVNCVNWYDTCNAWITWHLRSSGVSKTSGTWQTNYSTNNAVVTRTLSSASMTRADLVDGVFDVYLTANRENNGATTYMDVDSIIATVTYAAPANTAPVISSYVDGCAGTWTPGETCTVSFTSTDAETLGTDALIWVCLEAQVPYGDSSYCENPSLGTQSGVFFVRPNGTSAHTVQNDFNGTWDVDVGRTGDWNQTVQSWVIDITPGVEAALTSEGAAWELMVAVVDSSGNYYDMERGAITMIAANTAPTILNYGDSCGGTWVPTDECEISFRTFDPDAGGLAAAGATAVVVCAATNAPGDPPATADDVSCVPDGVQSAAWIVYPDGDAAHVVMTADELAAGVNQSWTAVDVERSADWSEHTIDWTMTIRIGDIAAASADWNLAISVVDQAVGVGSHLEVGNTVATSMVVKSTGDLDFGPLAPGAKSGSVDRSVQVRCNVLCALGVSTSDWANDATGALISPQTNWGVDPGPSEFALACRRTDGAGYDPGADVITEGQLIGPSTVSFGAVSDPFDPDPQPMTVEHQGDLTLNCGVQNGQTALGVYRGAVVFTVG